MMIACFIRSDAREGWNKKCSNSLPVPLQLLRHLTGPARRVSCSPTAPRAPWSPGTSAVSAQGQAHPAPPQLVLSQPAGWTAASLLLTSQQSSCPAHTPAWSFPTDSLRSALNKAACPVPLLWVTAASTVRTEIFTYLLHKTDVSCRHFRTYTQQHAWGKQLCSKQRKTCYTQLLSRVLHMSLVFRWWCCPASPQTVSLTCHWNQRKNSEWQVFAQK